MRRLLDTLMEQAELDAEKQAELIFNEGGQVFAGESESFGLCQEIWWN